MADFYNIPIEHTPVLIIGGSMVGLTLAALLAKQGVKGCITVEKHSSTAIHPRAALFHPRTMQIYRELGLYDAMVAESAKHYDGNAGIVNIESLAGKFLGSFMENMNEGIEKISPTVRLFLTQQMFEPMLRDRAIGDGADLRFSTEMVHFNADADGVTALVRSTETGEKRLIRAKYMIACDGNRSRVREALKIPMKSHGLLSHSLTIYFEMDVGKYVKGKYNGVIYINNPSIRGFFRLDKNGREGFLVVNTAGERGTEASRYPADNITDAKASEMLRAAVGADVEFKITLVSKWQAVCDVAETFVDSTRRVLLAGDAAHCVPPQGGFGGNTGIQDAHNLAWKLALVVAGQAGSELVEYGYEEERWPICRKTVDQVFERYIHRTAPELKEVVEKQGDTIEDEIPEPWLELGYRYHSRALVTDELGQLNEDPHTSTARPGSMAYHVHITLRGQQEAIPVADLLGDRFVLLLGSEADGWEDASRAIKRQAHLPEINVVRLGEDKQLCKKYAIESAGAVLIRPDGFVAWTSSDAAVFGCAALGMPDPTKMLVSILERILCLTPASQQQLGTAHLVNAAIERQKRTVPSTLSEALFRREQSLEKERQGLQERLAQIDQQLKDVRKMSQLQDEMSMLGTKIMPVQEQPPKYSFDDCIGRR